MIKAPGVPKPKQKCHRVVSLLDIHPPPWTRLPIARATFQEYRRTVAKSRNNRIPRHVEDRRALQYTNREPALHSLWPWRRRILSMLYPPARVDESDQQFRLRLRNETDGVHVA